MAQKGPPLVAHATIAPSDDWNDFYKGNSRCDEHGPIECGTPLSAPAPMNTLHLPTPLLRTWYRLFWLLNGAGDTIVGCRNTLCGMQGPLDPTANQIL